MKKATKAKTPSARKGTKNTTAVHSSSFQPSEFGAGFNTGHIRNLFWKRRGWQLKAALGENNLRYHPEHGWHHKVTEEFSWFLNSMLLAGDITLTQCEHTRLHNDEHQL